MERTISKKSFAKLKKPKRKFEKKQMNGFKRRKLLKKNSMKIL